MKVKLLKKLRRAFPIEIRNGRYRISYYKMYMGNKKHCFTEWVSKRVVIEMRREYILREAERCVVPKKRVYNI
jgi:hypothetical protein